jgi:hypothetical protein
MTNLLSSIGFGDVMIQVDEDYTVHIGLPMESAVVRNGRVTIELPKGNALADIAHAAIETLDAIDGIEADKLERIPDA